MLKLYHIEPGPAHPGSHNALKVSILLNELDVPYQRINLDPETEIRPAEAPYRQLNPNGKTPTLDDDGFVLWESAAILRYLAETRGGTRFYPAQPRNRARVDQWLTWEGTTLVPALMGLFTAATAPEPDPDSVAGATEILLSSYQTLEAQLENREYVTGDFSLADIALGSILCASFMMNLDLRPFPNILAWLDRLQSRSGWQEAIFLNDIALGREQGYFA